MFRSGFFRSSLIAALAAAGVMAGAAPGLADANKVIVVTPPVQLQVERDRQQAREFQLRQQINREQDRRMNADRQSSPNVPMMRSTCTPTNGVSCN